MNNAMTARGEVEAVLRAAAKPMTSTEIFERCTLVVDRAACSVVISQLQVAGRIQRVGERERERGKGAPFALYAIGDGVATKSRSGASQATTTDTAKAVLKAQAKAALAKVERSTAKKPPGKAARPLMRKVRTLVALPTRRPAAPAALPSLEVPGFRCGVWSDGTFAIHCEEGQITLQPAEAAALAAYINRHPDTKAR